MTPKSPSEINRLAKKQKPQPRYVCAEAYAPAVVELRKKNFTWKEVQEWLAGYGVQFSLNQLRNVAKNYKK
jgi:hypothetical protein